MAKPKGLKLRGTVWWVRKDVPKELVKFIGVTAFWKSTETSDYQRALLSYFPLMHGFESQIAQARAELEGAVPVPVDKTTRVDLSKFSDPFGAKWAVPETKQVQDMLERANILRPKQKPMLPAVVFDQWVSEKQPTQNTAAEYKRSLDLFVHLCGVRPIAEYSTEHASKWKKHVLEAGAGRAHATLEKHFGAVKTIFAFADRNDLLVRNPFGKIGLERPKRAKVNRRKEWTIDELRKLFASPVFTEQKMYSVGAAGYWLPVLSLFHGFRAGELAQMNRKDLDLEDGIYYLHVRVSDADQSLKTDTSHRRVPLHHEAIRLGFVRYVQSLKGTKMFPHLHPDTRGRWSGAFSKWFGRYRREIGLDQEWTDFHSFRHSWVGAAELAEIPEKHHDEISGHEHVGEGRKYGGIALSVLKKGLDRVRFDVQIPEWGG